MNWTISLCKFTVFFRSRIRNYSESESDPAKKTGSYCTRIWINAMSRLDEGVVGNGMGDFPDCGPLAEDSAAKLKRSS
jgi:hypothetical protein